MPHQSERSFERCLTHLERQVRVLRILSVLALAFFLITICLAFRARRASADVTGQVLTVRGLIIEDTQGRPRILLGAPGPHVKGRTRTDDANGIVLIGENGADRVVIGAPTPDGQANGRIIKRIVGASGLVVNDGDGNERGGLAVLDNGRGVACLDYPAPAVAEAICMGVVPDQGFAGLLISAATANNEDRAQIGVLKDGTSLLRLADTNGKDRVMVLVQGDKPARFLVIDPKTKSERDVLSETKP